MSDNGNHTAEVQRLRSVLVPREEHPAADLLEIDVDFAQLAKDVFPLPWGMVWDPPELENYLEVAFPNWIRFDGVLRTTNRQAKSFDHERFFIDLAARVPGGADLDKVRRILENAREGTLTLENRVVGTVTYNEVTVPTLAERDSSYLAVDIQVRFEPAKDEESAEILAKYRYGDGSSVVVNRKRAIYIARGEYLFGAMAPDTELVERVVADVDQRAMTAGLA